ncbi:MAG: DUF1800 domain-containing protein [Rubrivivax sp.]|nr:DUF1800 domain-containing protein [Pyrinomonadaceae bacterium]
MSQNHFSRPSARLSRWLVACAALVAFAATAAAQTAPGSPVLLTEGTGTTTRGVSYDAITFRSEPFPVVSPFNWNADKSNTSDQRTRIMVFAMNLNLLAGEGANALTADAQDAAGNLYPLKVEALTKPLVAGAPQSWLYGVVLRLDDSMTDTLGDVLVRINLHGVASNRVRVAIGQNGAGPALDPSTEFIAAAPATPPPPTPTPTPKAFGPNESNDADVVRLLEQASWGPTTAEVARVKSIGIRAYVNEQLNAPFLVPAVNADYPNLTFPLDDSAQQCPAGATQADCLRDNYNMYPVHRTFFTNALYGQDQLRQRVAFALHQVLVVSAASEVNRPSWMTNYLQILDRGAFGNYRTLLQDITLNPEMGEYLDMRLSTRTSPNENYPREILQLFSLGVNELNLDGTPKLDAQGVPIPSYSQTTVNEFTRVLTGWNLTSAISQGITNYRDPMQPRGGTSHDFGAKTLLSGVTTTACSSASGTPNIQCAQADLTVALDNIFNHPNVGPFVSKQLIQHLVTSNPSPAYVARVATVFNNNCNGLYPDNCTSARGDMKSVVRAVLLDPEARGDVKTDPNYGKLREPIQYINGILRAGNVKSFDKTTTSDGVLASRTGLSNGDFSVQLDQSLFRPTTVFSYYQPDYEVPGARILGPAFGILSTATTLRRANVVNSFIYAGITVTTGTNTDRPRGTSLDLANLEALASNPDAIADQLNALMLHGTMSTQVRGSIITAMNAIPTSDANFPRKRAQAALYLVATSSQYDIQR